MLAELPEIVELPLEANNRTWDTVAERGDKLRVYTDPLPLRRSRAYTETIVWVGFLLTCRIPRAVNRPLACASACSTWRVKRAAC